MAQPHTPDPAYHPDPTPDPTQDQAPAPAPTRGSRLLGLLRRVIDHGKQLLAKVQHNPSAEHGRRIGGSFGTWDIKLILARIMRGLEMAAELETRITDHPGRFDRPLQAQAAARAPATRKPRTRPTPSPPQDESNPALADLPTSEEIAAKLRRRPIGAVLIEICRNLGIMPSDPIWQEISHAVDDHGGSFLAFWKDATERASTHFLPPSTPFTRPKLPSPSERPPARAALPATGPP